MGHDGQLPKKGRCQRALVAVSVCQGQWAERSSWGSVRVHPSRLWLRQATLFPLESFWSPCLEEPCWTNQITGFLGLYCGKDYYFLFTFPRTSYFPRRIMVSMCGWGWWWWCFHESTVAQEPQRNTQEQNQSRLSSDATLPRASEHSWLWLPPCLCTENDTTEKS